MSSYVPGFLASTLESAGNVFAPAPAAEGAPVKVLVVNPDRVSVNEDAAQVYFAGIKVQNLNTSPAGAIVVTVVVYDNETIPVEVYRAKFNFDGNNEDLSDVLTLPVPVWSNMLLDVSAPGGAHNINAQVYAVSGALIAKV